MIPVFFIISAYLIGSIPTAVWYGNLFHNIDIRNFGSGNSGATNSLRVLGKRAGAIVFFIDFLKGYFAYNLPFLFSSPELSISEIPLSFVLGFAVVLGHVFPIFAQFRGGKGIATAFGVITAIYAWAALICLVVFVLIVFFTKYVSLGSILGACTFPLQVGLEIWKELPTQPYLFFSMLLAVFLLFTHRENVKKLIRGTENKLGQKKA